MWKSIEWICLRYLNSVGLTFHRGATQLEEIITAFTLYHEGLLPEFMSGMLLELLMPVVTCTI